MDLEIIKQTEEGHSHSTFVGNFEGDKVIIKHSKDEKVNREKEALQILKNFSIPVPEIKEFVEEDNESVLILEMIDHEFPERQTWKDIEFCREFVDSAARILNEIHSEPVMEESSSRKYCVKNKGRALRNMREKKPKIMKNCDKDLVKICENITESVEPAEKFTHGDFTTENILLSNGKLESVVDWAECGFTSQMRDVALFEASFIDEYIRFFHPNEYNNIRDRFREKTEIEDEEEYELYRFHQNTTVLAYIRDGGCSKEWLKVGSLSEIEKHRRKILEKDKEKVREILQSDK